MLSEWARTWAVSDQALADLRARLGALDPSPPLSEMATPINGEIALQSLIRQRASAYGMKLWRNNVGVLPDARGVPIRFGLANDSKAINRIFKSSDLIGISNEIIQPYDVGQPRGRFVAFECKAPRWHYTGDAHEQAQESFLKVVLAYGGRAKFINNEGNIL